MKELNCSTSERNKPREKEEKVLIIRIEKSFLKFKMPKLWRILNLVLDPKIAPKETNIISAIYYISLIFTHPLL